MMRASLCCAAAVAAAVAPAAARASVADPEDPVLPPVAWPLQHTHLEVQYTIDSGAISEKPVYYDCACTPLPPRTARRAAPRRAAAPARPRVTSSAARLCGAARRTPSAIDGQPT